ncbi:MAG: HmuY family protein [Ignavibacteria bacterium]|nr:HmuY family protein [Ignavibacteria bacterium]
MKLELRISYLIILLAFLACSKEENTTQNPPPQTIKAVTIYDLPADTGKKGKFTLFRLSDSTIVSNADSNSTKWDIGFAGTTIITNSGVRGPGQGGAIVLKDVDFNDVKEAPETGYRIENSLTDLAIPTGSGNGWYNYNPQTHIVSPIPGRVIIIRTADGKYAKLQIISYWKGNPQPIDPFTHKERFYTFRYVYQSNGTRKFE